MKTSIKDHVSLTNGAKMPSLGFGTYLINDGEDIVKAIHEAFKVGYRHIDTAALYNNETGVGIAIRETSIPREEIFLTTKIWTEDLRQKRTLAAFDESMDRLGLDYVDLILIHWPVKGFYVDSWKTLIEINKTGRAKSIGVSNFMIHHLEDLANHSEIRPIVNQIEFHPWLVQPKLLEYCNNHEIQVVAWSPLMQGKVTEVKTITDLAKKYNKTPAQVVLRWNLQHGVIPIPKSAKPHRILENSQIFDFKLEESDVALIDALDQRRRLGADPNNFDF